jgi:hypothetical protein
MLIAGSQTKYYLLSLFGALVVAFGVFAISPASEAQEEQPPAAPPTIDKECTPNPVQVGQQITCTIDVVPAPSTADLFRVTDPFPAGVTVTETNWAFVFDGEPFSERGPCRVDGNNVTCPRLPGQQILIGVIEGEAFRATITATAVQCGTFPNTATASGTALTVPVNAEPLLFPFTVEDTEEIIVEGCEEPPVQQPVGGGGAAPITQEGEQESESGEIEQTFEVS